MLERLHPANASTEHLFVGTDRYMYFTVSWDSQTRQLRTEKSYQDQAEKTARDSQTEDQCLIDPTRRFMALLLYDGIVTILPILQQGKKKGTDEPGTLGDPVPARISDLFVRSSTFLHPRRQDAEAALLPRAGRRTVRRHRGGDPPAHRAHRGEPRRGALGRPAASSANSL